MSRQKFVRSADSKSLWNCTLSPGWSSEEVIILRFSIMRFGLGAWTQILKANVLPGKTAAQLNLQTQRMMGQQSLGGFMGIKLDCGKVWEDNNKKQGPEYKRKNGCLVNTGNNPTKEERQRQIEENRAKYGLSQEEIDAVVIPEKVASSSEKKIKLKKLKATLAYLEKTYIAKFGPIPPIPEWIPTEKTEEKKSNVKTSDKSATKRKTSKETKSKPKAKKKTIEEYMLEDEESEQMFIVVSDNDASDDDFTDSRPKRRKTKKTSKSDSASSSGERSSSRRKKVKAEED